MYQLVYVSTARPSLDQCELSRILNSARRRNHHDGVSGLLTFDGTYFLQALEGERDMVESVYARVAGDARHRVPEIVTSGMVTGRQFGDWTMAWGRVARLDPRRRFNGLIDSLVPQLGDANLRGLFRSIAGPERRAA